MAVVQKKAGGSSEAEGAAHLLLAILDCSLLTILSSVLPLEGLPQGLSTHTDSPCISCLRGLSVGSSCVFTSVLGQV